MNVGQFALTPIVADASNAQHYGLYEPPDLSRVDYKLHSVAAHEVARPDLIAYQWYRDVRLWWVICDFNDIFDPLADMYAGQVLKVPDADQVSTALAVQGE